MKCIHLNETKLFAFVLSLSIKQVSGTNLLNIVPQQHIYLIE